MHTMNKIIVSICLLLLPFINPAQEIEVSATRAKVKMPVVSAPLKNLVCDKAAVVSANPIASEVGLSMIQKGGNAFDAMIATQLALAVVYPGAGNLGGGGFLLARKADGGLISLDFRETAGEKASADMYLDAKGNAQNILSERGHLSAGVPGTVSGIFATLPYAKLTLKELIQPAIELAATGFKISAAEADNLNENKEDFIKFNTNATAFVKEALWKEGDILVQKELSKTLMRIRDFGSKGFYEGETAKLIVAEMERGKGILSLNDLKNYTTKIRQHISFTYRGYNIISFPPPSSGGILLGQMLGMIEPFPMSDYGFQTAKSVHVMIEAERRAYADRAEHMGDPDFWKVPQKMLLSKDYLKERMKDFKEDYATKSADIKAGTIYESEETTHISIIDAEGNMVAVTTTLNDSYGSHTVVSGAGFILNDEMDDFSIKPGVPNMYGAVGGKANAIAAGKRMLSSMTPTLVLKDKKPFMVVGTPGGTTIPTSVFQTIVNVIDFGMNADDAVNKPKFHHQWLPDEVFIENRFSTTTAAELKKMGYSLKERGEIGRTELIKILPDGKREAAADSRGDDSVAGY